MCKLAALFCFALCMASSLAYAQQTTDGPKEKRPYTEELKSDIQRLTGRMRPEWLACQMAADCDLVWYNCSEALAGNKAHLSEIQAEICGTEVCDWAQCVRTYDFSATCEESRCVTKFESLKQK